MGHILLTEIRDARRSAGWTRTTLAERIGIDVQVIKRLEQGVGSVPLLMAVMSAVDFHLMGIGPGRPLAEQLGKRRRKPSCCATIWMRERDDQDENV